MLSKFVFDPALGHRPIQPTPSTRQRKGHSSGLRKSKKIRLLTWSRLKAPIEFMSSSSICMSTECCSVLCNSEALSAHLLSKLSCEISHGHDGSFMKKGSLRGDGIRCPRMMSCWSSGGCQQDNRHNKV